MEISNIESDSHYGVNMNLEKVDKAEGIEIVFNQKMKIKVIIPKRYLRFNHKWENKHPHDNTL